MGLNSTKLRTLIIDDDQAALERINSEVRGESLEQEGRRVEMDAHTLLVEVESRGRDYHFTPTTLARLREAANEKWDLILLDYSFAAKDIQPHQWGENRNADRLKTNDHLVTVVNLRTEALASAGQSKADRKRLEQFFNRSVDLVLRSFQHDRPVDALGSYETRYNNTQGAFPNARIHRLDSFSMIYGADADLRERFYLDIYRGREFYRNIVTTLTILHVRAALARRLARSNLRIAVPRASAILALMTSAVWAISAVLSAMVPDLVKALRSSEWLLVAKFSVYLLVVTVVSTCLLTLLVDRGVSKIFRSEP